MFAFDLKYVTSTSLLGAGECIPSYCDTSGLYAPALDFPTSTTRLRITQKCVPLSPDGIQRSFRAPAEIQKPRRVTPPPVLLSSTEAVIRGETIVGPHSRIADQKKRLRAMTVRTKTAR